MKLFLRVLCVPLAVVLGILLRAAFLALGALAVSCVPVNVGSGGEGTIPVYVRTNGAHVDLLVPVKTDAIDWREVVDPRDTRAPLSAAECPYVSFGWGAKEFYLNVQDWEHLTARAAVRAVFGLGGSALHTCYEREPSVGPDCARLAFGREQYAVLVAYFLGSARRDGNGRFVPVDTATRYGGRDAFYEGTGRYTPVNTCNTWANRALLICGKRCCLWSAVPGPIFRQVRAGQL